MIRPKSGGPLIEAADEQLNPGGPGSTVKVRASRTMFAEMTAVVPTASGVAVTSPLSSSVPSKIVSWPRPDQARDRQRADPLGQAAEVQGAVAADGDRGGVAERPRRRAGRSPGRRPPGWPMTRGPGIARPRRWFSTRVPAATVVVPA